MFGYERPCLFTWLVTCNVLGRENKNEHWWQSISSVEHLFACSNIFKCLCPFLGPVPRQPVRPSVAATPSNPFNVGYLHNYIGADAYPIITSIWDSVTECMRYLWPFAAHNPHQRQSHFSTSQCDASQQYLITTTLLYFYSYSWIQTPNWF